MRNYQPTKELVTASATRAKRAKEHLDSCEEANLKQAKIFLENALVFLAKAKSLVDKEIKCQQKNS